jgi:hypothetical protein
MPLSFDGVKRYRNACLLQRSFKQFALMMRYKLLTLCNAEG